MDRLKGERTRSKILDAALELFYEKGAHKVSFQDIGNKVKITQPAIYTYYKNKDDLLVACANYAATSGRNVIDLIINPRDSAFRQLKNYLEGNLSWVFKFRREANAILAMYYFAASSDHLADLHKKIDEIGISRIETYLIAGEREHTWKIRDTQNSARLIHNLLVGEMLKAFNRPKELSIEKRLAMCWSAVQKILAE